MHKYKFKDFTGYCSDSLFKKAHSNDVDSRFFRSWYNHGYSGILDPSWANYEEPYKWLHDAEQQTFYDMYSTGRYVLEKDSNDIHLFGPSLNLTTQEQNWDIMRQQGREDHVTMQKYSHTPEAIAKGKQTRRDTGVNIKIKDAMLSGHSEDWNIKVGQSLSRTLQDNPELLASRAKASSEARRKNHPVPFILDGVRYEHPMDAEEATDMYAPNLRNRIKGNLPRDWTDRKGVHHHLEVI